MTNKDKQPRATALKLLFREARGNLRFQKGPKLVALTPNTADLRDEDLPDTADSVAINLVWNNKPKQRSVLWVSHLCALFATVRTGEQIPEWLPEPSLSIAAAENTTFLWLLRDRTKRHIPPRRTEAPTGTQSLYNRALKTINRACAPAGAEPEQASVTSHVPLPSAEAEWIPCAATPSAYTLSEILAALGIREPKKRKQDNLPNPSAPPTEKATLARRKGRIKLLQLRQARLTKLARLRADSGYEWTEELAREAIRLAASFAGSEGVSDLTVSRRVLAIHRLLGEPFKDGKVKREMQKALASSSGFKLQDQSISDRLQITPPEYRVVGWLPASRFQAHPPPRRTRNQEATERRRQLAQCIVERGLSPSINEARGLLAELGYDVDRSCTQRDMNAIRKSNANPASSK